MNLRQARLADADELRRMRLALWPDSEDDHVGDVIGTPPSEGVVLVAESSDGRLVGFAEFGVRKFADGCDSSPVAYLEGIWVEDASRRTGVASDLVRAGEKWARSLGLSEMASDCEIANGASEAFHIAFGFEEVQRSICFRRPLDREEP